jgi:uncharacterized tellurite resistance protein B-like protein
MTSIAFATSARKVRPRVLDAIREYVARHIHPATPEPGESASSVNRVHLAACALLLELAHADDEFSPPERAHIGAVLQRHFGLEAGTARELVELAEVQRQQSSDYYQFTRLIVARYDLGQRMVLAEIMWGVILADGRITEHESYLVRKLGQLLDLSPAYLSQARAAVTGDESA